MRRSARKRREVVRYGPSDVVARGRERGDDDDEDDDDGVKRTRGRPTRKRAGDDDDDDDDDDGDDDDDKGAAKVGEASTRGEGVDGAWRTSR